MEILEAYEVGEGGNGGLEDLRCVRGREWSYRMYEMDRRSGMSYRMH